jgi:ornithine racemase
MAHLKLYRDRLRHNYLFLHDLLGDKEISWGVVTKMFCGNPTFLKEILDLGINEVHDSRISNLKAVKKINPAIQTVYIKPPPKNSAASLIQWADVSFNTELETIRALSAQAQRQNKLHKIIIMIEMGDLREGVMRDDVVNFYAQVFDLPNIQVVGLGTNLNCLHGIMPNADKLIQLALYREIIEMKFNRRIPWVSGGTTVTLPLLIRGDLPSSVNHFRIGEALYFGADLFAGNTIEGMRDDVLTLFTEIIELHQKPLVPSGDLGVDPRGNIAQINEALIGQTTWRAIVDVGHLDINPDFLVSIRADISVLEASSDMLVLDLGENSSDLKVGDHISFNLRYMGALGLMNSRYIDKIVE